MCKRKRNEQEEKANSEDFNINKRQATNMVIKAILIIVVAMLVTYITLFILFNFLYPAVSNGSNSGNSHALGSCVMGGSDSGWFEVAVSVNELLFCL